MSLGSAPTSSTQLGYKTDISVSQTTPYTLTNGSSSNFTFNTSGLPKGTYLGILNSTINPTAGTNRIDYIINYVY